MMPLLITLCCTPLDLPYLSPEIFLQILYSHLNEVPQKSFQPSQPFALLCFGVLRTAFSVVSTF